MVFPIMDNCHCLQDTIVYRQLNYLPVHTRQLYTANLMVFAIAEALINYAADFLRMQ
jgi:hypothetical protein